VVGIALAPSGGGLSVLRGLRVLRVLRVVNNAPSLKRIINAMAVAIPGMSSICALLGILYYVGAVMATKLFGEAFPEWFGNIAASVYTLFQVMTLESWSVGIVRPVMEQFPYAWTFFLPFIVVATFTMLNLFVGVVVNAMQAAAAEGDKAAESAKETEPTLADLDRKLTVLTEQLAALQAKGDDKPYKIAS
jgi:voltage-gated sodium channel